MSDEEKPPRIVVRDRRAFRSDGSRREGVEPPRSADAGVAAAIRSTDARPPEPSPPPPAVSRKPPSSRPEAAPEGPSPKEEPRFKQLVSLLFSQAAVLLEQAPEGRKRTGKKPPAASPEILAGLQAVIGLLEVLQEKTRGRLAPGDARLLSQVLYQLRMAYMERAGTPGK